MTDVKATITDLAVRDIRLPTSARMDGSDPMHTDPDYSATYVVLSTDLDLEGHGLTFTLGRGNEVCVAAVQALSRSEPRFFNELFARRSAGFRNLLPKLLHLVTETVFSGTHFGGHAVEHARELA